MVLSAYQRPLRSSPIDCFQMGQTVDQYALNPGVNHCTTFWKRIQIGQRGVGKNAVRSLAVFEQIETVLYIVSGQAYCQHLLACC